MDTCIQSIIVILQFMSDYYNDANLSDTAKLDRLSNINNVITAIHNEEQADKLIDEA